MPKTMKPQSDPRQQEDTDKLYAHAYAARLAKQVEDELVNSRRKAGKPMTRQRKP
jgi:hypothetical protein